MGLGHGGMGQVEMAEIKVALAVARPSTISRSSRRSAGVIRHTPSGPTTDFSPFFITPGALLRRLKPRGPAAVQCLTAGPPSRSKADSPPGRAEICSPSSKAATLARAPGSSGCPQSETVASTGSSA